MVESVAVGGICDEGAAAMRASLVQPKGNSASCAAPAGGRVAVLLSTHNGERFIREQLDSIIAQTHGDWVLHVSDDGSQDGTLAILRAYQALLGAERLQIREGPCRGFAENFMSLLLAPELVADYYAFCDQDDIWHPHKLERALAALVEGGVGRAAMYCSRTRLVDEGGRHLGFSPRFQRKPSFRNALVQSLAGGNTMVINDQARRLVQSVGAVPIVSHDWWIYLLLTACDGTVIYDPRAHIDYRQHGANLIGANSALSDRLYRVNRMMKGDFRAWSQTNLGALEVAKPLLSTANRDILQCFVAARDAGLTRRATGLLRLGIYRQTLLGNLGLVVAALLKRI